MVKFQPPNRWLSYSKPIPCDFQPLLSYMARHRVVIPQRLCQGFRAYIHGDEIKPFLSKCGFELG